MMNTTVKRSKDNGSDLFVGSPPYRYKRKTCIRNSFVSSGTTLVGKENHRNTKVDITPLIRFAAELPEGPLKSVLLSEIDDEIDVATFLSLYPRWLRLARMKK